MSDVLIRVVACSSAILLTTASQAIAQVAAFRTRARVDRVRASALDLHQNGGAVAEHFGRARLRSDLRSVVMNADHSIGAEL